MAEYSICGDAEYGVSEIAVGDTLHIKMKDNPNTGYVWTLDTLPTDALELLGSKYVEADSNCVGGGGWRVFKLAARRPGDMTVMLKRKRKWENAGSAIDLRHFRIRISSR